jgi:hypothetical protein
MPSERSNDRYQRVFQGIGVVGIAYENVKRKGNVDGKPSPVHGEFNLVSVIDLLVEVRRFGEPYSFHRLD